MRRSRRTRTLSASVVLAATVLAGCGGDELDRSEFIQQVTDKQGGLDRPLANCVYDRMRRDAALLSDLREHSGWSDEIAVESDEKMQRILARCILDQDTGETTPTTTTSAPER